MSRKNKDDSSEAKGKSSQPSSEEAEDKLPHSMNYPWQDDEGMLDAALEALDKLPVDPRWQEN